MSRLFDDANTEYLEIDSAVVTATPYTFACWFYSDDATLNQSAIFIGDKDVENQFASLQISGGIAGDPVSFFVNTGGATTRTDTTTGYTANMWHHACGVAAADDDRRIYIDGGSKNTSGAGRAPTNWDRTSIGRRGDSTPSNYMSGRIAEAAIWNAALTDDEVAALAGGVSPRRIRPESLVAYWPLYGVASPEPDYAGIYDLTLFSGDGGPVVADHAPVQVPFGYDVSWIEFPITAARIPRPPAAYFDGPTIF